MSKYFDNIMEGLNEALEDSKKKNLKRKYISFVPVKDYTKEEVKKIRNSTGMSQRAFAQYMGVSVKTVESWEAGKNTPNGSASRILDMISNDDQFTEKYPFVVMS